MRTYSTRTKRLLLGLCWLCGVVFWGSGISVRADTGGANAQGSSVEADALLRQMQEIACLQLITPLHLTDAQLTKIEAILEATIKNYDQQMKAVATKYFADLIPKIEAAHREALLGKQPPSDLQQKFEDALGAVLKERDQINEKNIAAVANSVRPLLTDDQIRTAVKLAHTIPEFKTRTGTDAQWFNLWVASALLNYDHIVPLLKELQKAQATASTTNSNSDKK
ncbi:hypothetical protein CTKA_01032 [Chthonomonas calidirosea]|uniref:Uncharacterized protein n=1 Tax=Chthonomonas calidirosea (strain DSM 23976 / ICMP 18418 / T49) TaxID=1303518 RepID=S0ESP4_CHTCT|nr:hypothetical protein [Chthonomonas calidirosea]CCW33965.1 hypothetical protein CCALI_00126 [Chthonomonas calidirosea T49]CEK16152.1 hypothetical protein CTKA_01032 [Chthonomonas calidirosea]